MNSKTAARRHASVHSKVVKPRVRATKTGSQGAALSPVPGAIVIDGLSIGPDNGAPKEEKPVDG